MEEIPTLVALSRDELQTLIDLTRIAQARLTLAEKYYYDALLQRLLAELEAQGKN